MGTLGDAMGRLNFGGKADDGEQNYSKYVTTMSDVLLDLRYPKRKRLDNIISGIVSRSIF